MKEDTPEGFTALAVASVPALPWLWLPSGPCFLVLFLLLRLLCITLPDPVHPAPAPGFQKYVLRLFLFVLRVQPLASPPEAQQGDGLVPLDWLAQGTSEDRACSALLLSDTSSGKTGFDNFGSHLSFPCF